MFLHLLKNNILMFFKKSYLLDRPWVENYMNLFDETFFLKYVFILGCATFLLRMGFSLQWLVMELGL